MKTFPIMAAHGERYSQVLLPQTTIPWDMIAPHARQADLNHSQTLERLAERGGLSRCEAIAILQDRRWHKMALTDAKEVLEHLVEEWEATRHQLA
jgi:hypothetical protein